MKNNKSKYFDGEQIDGLYGLDLFLNFYENNVNFGSNDDYDATATYERNPNCWAANLDTTCVSVSNMHPTSRNPNGGGLWNSSNVPNGTLISPKHVIFAKHFHAGENITNPYNGTYIRFVTMNNITITRTITKIDLINDKDIAVATLDSDVPDSITFAKILPDNYSDYLFSLTGNNHKKIYGILINQDKSALIKRWIDIQKNIIVHTDTDPETQQSIEYIAFSRSIRMNDSSSPFLIFIDNIPIILSVESNGHGGPNIYASKNEINNIMLSNSNYTLTTANLNKFLNKTYLPEEKFVVPYAPPPPEYPNGIPLYGCGFLDVDGNNINISFTTQITINSWSSPSGYGILYDTMISDYPRWVITQGGQQLFYANDPYQEWYVIEDGLIVGYNKDDILPNATISLGSCE